MLWNTCLARWQVRHMAHQAVLAHLVMDRLQGSSGRSWDIPELFTARWCALYVDHHSSRMLCSCLQDRALDGAGDHQAPKIHRATQECNIQPLPDSNSGAWAGTGADCVSRGAGFGELQTHSSVPALQELSGLDLAVPDLPACLWAPAPLRFHPGENFSFGTDNSCHSIFCTGLHPSLAVLFCNFLSHIIAA